MTEYRYERKYYNLTRRERFWFKWVVHQSGSNKSDYIMRWVSRDERTPFGNSAALQVYLATVKDQRSFRTCRAHLPLTDRELKRLTVIIKHKRLSFSDYIMWCVWRDDALMKTV